jgi:methylmalonyl-CoA mutase N-terminal domain/subunit
MREQFHAKKPESQCFRFGPGTSGVTLTAQQAENNIVRVTLEALAAILGGAQYLHTSSFDEAHGIPTERAATIALRTQQILAYESGITDVVDPLGGSYYVESLTNEIETQVSDYLEKIESIGGILKAVERGWAQQEIARSAYIKQKEIEEGRRIVVGLNKFGKREEPTFKIHQPKLDMAQEMKKRLEKLRSERNNNAVQYCLEEIRETANGKNNLVPVILKAVKEYATVGEICNTLRDVWGEYREPNIF